MKNFYRAFEEKYYASRNVIKEIRKQYLPFIESLISVYHKGLVFDLGCGRGEWLELMQELGLTPYGVDIDEGMLQACFDLNLQASKADGAEFLKTLESDSHIAITAFHVVEHLSFENLQVIIQEALRVLKPGGLLIMETPNPENIKVATSNFYIDHTHIRPIPAELLSFTAEYYGFARVKSLRLQESKDIAGKEHVTLLEVINGVSPDYAIIAQKQASQEVMSWFNELFEKEYGISLVVLADKFEKRLSDTEKRLSDTEKRLSDTENRLSDTEKQLSKRWKFRLLLNFSHWFINGSFAWLTLSPGSRPRRILRRFLIIAKQYVSSKPRIKKIMVRIISLSPKLKARLKMVGNGYSLPPELSDTEKRLSDTWEFRLLNFSRRFINGSVAWLTLSPGSRPRRILRRLLIIAKQYVSSKPRIKKIMVRIISLSPKLKARLKMVGNDYSLPTKLSDTEKQRIISSRAQNIFNILKETIKRNSR